MPSAASRRALRRSPAPLALMALIFYLSGQSDPGPDLGAAARVIAHAGEFALLTVLWAWVLAPRLGARSIAVAAVIALLYAVSDEYHQTFVDGRDGSVADVAIDAVGITLATVALTLRARGRRTARRARGRPARTRLGGGERS